MISISAPAILSRRNGNEMPAKLEPPPAQPITTSGPFSPNAASCSLASRPITVWCMSTWLSTEPSEYAASGSVAARSTASEIASPSEPSDSGSASSAARPAFVAIEGLECTVAPNVSIITRRYGFWRYEMPTMKTSHSSPYSCVA